MSEALVDWSLAERVGTRIAGVGPAGAWPEESVAVEASGRAAELVVEYTGLEPRGEIPEAESIGRAEWVRVNLGALRTASVAIESGIGASVELPGAIGGAARALSSRVIAAEAGAVVGYAAHRVLGQYDLALLGAPRAPRLLFVAPNIAALGRDLGRGAALLDWIALHEVTHAVQFQSTPWLRDHLGGLLETLIAGTDPRGVASNLLDAARSAVTRDPRELLDAVRSIDPIRSLLGPEQAALLARLQAGMSAIEGYADFVMDGAGGRAQLDVSELRMAFEERRRTRNPLETLLARLLGVELKLRQYREGRRFADHVAARGGVDALNLLWSAPDALPSATELDRPEAWLSRVAGT